MSTFGDNFRRLLSYESSRDAVTVQRVWREAKLTTGCESPVCQGHPREPIALDAAHLDPATKYRTTRGETVEPADMVKSNGRGRTRYGTDTIAREADRCRVLCRNCHAVETARERISPRYPACEGCGVVSWEVDWDSRTCPPCETRADFDRRMGAGIAAMQEAGIWYD